MNNVEQLIGAYKVRYVPGDGNGIKPSWDWFQWHREYQAWIHFQTTGKPNSWKEEVNHETASNEILEGSQG